MTAAIAGEIYTVSQNPCDIFNLYSFHSKQCHKIEEEPFGKIGLFGYYSPYHPVHS